MNQINLDKTNLQKWLQKLPNGTSKKTSRAYYSNRRCNVQRDGVYTVELRGVCMEKLVPVK